MQQVASDLYRSWVDGRLKVASSLATQRGHNVADACVILFSLIGALSVDFWPEKSKPRLRDGARFVQLLVDPRTNPQSTLMRTVSLPYLHRHLQIPYRARQRLWKRWLLERKGFSSNYKNLIVGNALVLGSEVDLCSEAQIVADLDLVASGAIPAKVVTDVVRSCSYGALLYRDLRNVAIHEYRQGDRAVLEPVLERFANTVPRYAPEDTALRFPAVHLIEMIRGITIRLASNGRETSTAGFEVRFRRTKPWYSGDNHPNYLRLRRSS